MVELIKLEKLLSIILTTNVTREQLFSLIKYITTALRKTTTSNKLSHCLMLHVYCEKVGKPNIEELLKNSGNLARR